MKPTIVAVKWDAKDTRVYNASIGLGAAPEDSAFLDHGSHRRSGPGLQAFPTLPLGMLHRNAPAMLAPWRSGAEADIMQLVTCKAQDLVHGDQAIIWHSAIPVEADAEVHHHVAGLAQKRTGVVLTTHSEFHATGRRRCTSVASMFLRKGSLTKRGSALAASLADNKFGEFADLRMRQALFGKVASSRQSSGTVNVAANQAALYAINGDDNPIHVDFSVAQAAGFQRPILHGLCTFGIALRSVLLQVSPDVSHCEVRFEAAAIRFARPVFPPCALEVVCNDVKRRGNRVSVLFSVYNGPLVVCTHGVLEYTVPTAKL